ncbi:MAG: VCBS domain-containing protein, partial [Acidimicrobiales bacterium]|nr:VCBS domain-containing protein [Acidimicrobiales bacterium]
LPGTVRVEEEALDTTQDGDDLAAGSVDGSNPTSTLETITGQLSFTGDGAAITSVTFGGTTTALVGGTIEIATDYGVIQVNADGSYVYTLTDPASHAAPPDNTVVLEKISYTVTDSDGDTDTSSLTIEIVDDVPYARDDSNSVGGDIGNTTGGNVVTDAPGADTLGADGATVTSVDGSDLTGGTVTVTGTYGTLVLNADGSYQYTVTSVPSSDAQESFDYTLTDGDGDTSVATLTIDVFAPPPAPEVVNQTLDVDEAALDGIGSASGSDAESTSGAIKLSDVSSDAQAITSVDYTDRSGAAQTAAVVAGGTTVETQYGSLTINPDGTYSYTLEIAADHSGGDVSEAFSFDVSLAGGGSVAGGATLTVGIEDDLPTAEDDANFVDDAGVASGNVLTGDGQLDGGDVLGADQALDGSLGTRVTTVEGQSVAFGGSVSITGLYGTLVINSDGSYTYTVTGSAPAGAEERFTYEITDGDGDTDEAILSIGIPDPDGDIPVALPGTVRVEEEALDTTQDGDDLAAGSVDGSNPTSTLETITGQL